MVLNYDEFNNLFDCIQPNEEVTDIDAKAYQIINTIEPYCDCMGEFVNTLSHESINAALNMLREDSIHRLEEVMGTETAIALLSNIRERSRPAKIDLF